MKCPHCSRDIDKPVHFCPWCGISVGKKDDLFMERLMLIFMRADLSGFTKMSESMIAEDVMVFLNEVFNVFSKVVETYKGIVYDIIGDEIVSVFGYPKESGFAPHMAIFAAEDMMKRLNRINADRAVGVPIGLKIGVAMEEAALFGSQKNIATSIIITQGFTKSQVLQKNADNNTVLVCSNLFEATKAFFSYQEIGEFVKDSVDVHAYEYKIKEK